MKEKWLWKKKVRPQEEAKEEEEKKKEVGDWQVQFLLERVCFSCLLIVDEVKGCVCADWLHLGFHHKGFRLELFFSYGFKMT